MRFSVLALALSLSLASAAPTTPAQQITLGSSDALLLANTLTRPELGSSDDLRLQEHIDSLPERRRIRLQDLTEHAITEGEKSLLVYNGIKFDDITEELSSEQLLATSLSDKSLIPSELSFSAKDLKPYFDHIDTKRMKETLTKFTSFYTRYYRSPTGKQSQAWLLAQVRSIGEANPKLNITVSEFPHPWGARPPI